MIEDHEIAAYLLGDAPEDVRARVRAAAEGDPDLREQLAALGPLASEAPVSPAPVVAPAVRPRRWRPWGRPTVVAAGVVVAVSGVVWGGYELLRTPPLLQDSFGKRTIEYRTWHPRLGRKGVSAEDGYLRLLNRGSVVTRREFDVPIEIEFDWRWIDHGQWPLYAEVLSVGLRSTGRQQEEHDYRLKDGFVVEFNCVEHSVRAVAADDMVVVSTSGPDSVPFVPGEWYHVRIADDGAAVSVFVTGPSVDQKYKTQPVLTAPFPSGLTGKRVAFYNREYTAKTNHESQVDNIVIWPKK